MGLFGGSKTTVHQTSVNQTDIGIDVGIENIMDMTGIERVLEWLGFKTVEFQEGQLAASVEGGSLMSQLLEAQKQDNEQKQQVIGDMVPWAKAVMAAAVVALGVFAWKKWKGRK